jgi:putative flippase GtrA
VSEVIRSITSLRLFRFIVVGVGAALLLFTLTFLFVSVGLPPFPGSVLAYGIAFVVAYSAQRGWTFGGRHDHSHALPRYLVVQVGCALLAGVVSHVAVTQLGLAPFAMSALATVAASATSYVLCSVWVFADRG